MCVKKNKNKSTISNTQCDIIKYLCTHAATNNACRRIVDRSAITGLETVQTHVDRSLQRVRHRDGRSDKSRALSSPAGVLCYHCGDAVDSDRGKDNAGVTNDRVGGSRVPRPLVRAGILLLSSRRALYGCLSRSRERLLRRVPLAWHARPIQSRSFLYQKYLDSSSGTRFRRFRKGREMNLKNCCGLRYIIVLVLLCMLLFYVLLSSFEE